MTDQARCGGSGRIACGPDQDGTYPAKALPAPFDSIKCPGCPDCLKEEEAWICDSCGKWAPIDTEGWEVTTGDDAGVSVERCPTCRLRPDEDAGIECDGCGKVSDGTDPNPAGWSFSPPSLDDGLPTALCPDCEKKSATPEGQGAGEKPADSEEGSDANA